MKKVKKNSVKLLNVGTVVLVRIGSYARMGVLEPDYINHIPYYNESNDTYLVKMYDTGVLRTVHSVHVIKYETLSARELSCLRLLYKGYKNRDIANELKINEKTVSTYKLRLANKLFVPNEKNDYYLVTQAIKLSLIDEA